MRNLTDEIEDARAKVAHCRIRAERPGSRLEDDFALEKARTRLLTLELRQLKMGGTNGQGRSTDGSGRPRSRSEGLRGEKNVGTKSEQGRSAPRDRAERVFAKLFEKREEKGGSA